MASAIWRNGSFVGEPRVTFDVGEYSRRLGLVSAAEDVICLRAAVMHALAMMGIHGAYFLAPLTADPRVGRVLTVIGLPRIWERHYRARLYLLDPLPAISLRSTGAFAWPEVFESTELAAKERRYLSIAAKAGMGHGIGVACYGPHGRSGFLGCAWSAAEQPPIPVVQAVHMIGQTSFQRYCQLVPTVGEIQSLSNRELEVLSWMREGKSNSVIAQILAISRGSVDEYVRRIFAKLGVTDRTAACLRGYALGLIVSNEHRNLMEVARARDPNDWI
jgi:LuxR family transcriptional regulator, quorum-sensing system regulator CciR